VIYIHFRLQAAIFDILLTLTKDGIRTSAVMLLDLKNIGIAVGIVLISCVKAEIYVISYLLNLTLLDTYQFAECRLMCNIYIDDQVKIII